MTNLTEIADHIKNFIGVRRKLAIAKSIKSLEATLNLGIAKVIKSFGEDAAFIEISNIDTDYFLLAMDGMWEKLIDADPYLAGYFSILVNVDDIVVKGGIPLALLNTISSTRDLITVKMMEGIVDGCKKFSVPMVGGHYHPNANTNSLSVAILGKVEKNSAVFSDSAKEEDSILIGIDMDGSFNTKFKYAFNTTQHKNPVQIQKIFEAWRKIAQNKLVTAAKDISNPGIIGTLGMLLDASKKGGKINISKIPKPENIQLDTWLKAYPGYGIIFTAKKNSVFKIKQIFSDVSIVVEEIGEINNSRKLIIEDGSYNAEVFDFRKINLSGLSHD
ncbi:MAG: AIR synthase related protein [Candidatus Helarchaeota archaeon]